MRYRTRVLAIAGVALAVIAGIPITIGIVRFSHHPLSAIFETSFDAREWRAHSSNLELSGECERDSPREAMVDDLTDNHLRRGMTCAELRKLIGPPDQHFGGGWDYCLGMWSGFRIDYDWLSLSFDETGRLASWGEWQD